MNRYSVKLLLVNDADVECKTENDLSQMSLANLNFIPSDLEGYDMIVYQGKRGTKILKSKYTNTGIVK